MDKSSVIKWLLEDSDPAVKYRTQIELLDIAKNSQEVKQTHKLLLLSDNLKSVLSLFDQKKDFADSHAFSALVEYGLTRMDVDIDNYVERHLKNIDFRAGCGGGFLLRNLITLGYAEHPIVKNGLELVLNTQKSDGGFPCTSKNPKINKPSIPHKSCFQMTTSYLLLTAEMFKQGLDCPQMNDIANYFLGREVLYRNDDPQSIVVGVTGMTFHPPVCTRVGLHMILYALSILKKGDNPNCCRAWELLYKKRNSDGKYLLDGSLTKPYIKTEKPNLSNKWVTTFYALLAEKHRDNK